MIQYARHAMEFLWLATVFLVPLIVASSDSMLSYIQLPKVALLRTTVGLIAMLWAIEWAIKSSSAAPSSSTGVSFRFKSWVAEDPMRWLLVAAFVFMSVNVLSTLLSPEISISVWGSTPGEDGYGLYNVVSYFILFLAVATHLRARAQLWRLLGAIVASGLLSALFGVFEHYQVASFGNSEREFERITSTFGNPIFFAAFLLMTIPISLGLYMSVARKFARNGYLVIWSLIIGLQVLAFILTLSRGPWIGLVLGFIGFFVAGLIVMERRALLSAAVALGASLALAVIVMATLTPPSASDASAFADNSQVAQDSTPKPGSTTQDESAAPSSSISLAPSEAIDRNVGAVRDRILSIYASVADDGLTSRDSIWKNSGKLIVDRPWFPFEDLPLAFLRPLVGYGPEMYGFVYPLESPPDLEKKLGTPQFAHNHIIHETVELGYLGLLSYLALLCAIFLPAVSLLARNWRGYAHEHRVVLIALLSALGARFIEQMAGIAQVSDLTLFWVLLAILVALPTIMGTTPSKAGDTRVRYERISSNTMVWRVGAALVVVVVFASLIWAKNVNYVRADLVAASSRDVVSTDASLALSLMEKAITLAPDVPLYYQDHANILSAFNDASDDPEVSADLAERIYVDRLRAMQVSPLAMETRLQLANAAFKLARLGYGGKGQEALQLYLEVAAMLPNSSSIGNLLAVAYIEQGRSADSLEVLAEQIPLDMPYYERAKNLYLQGVAYNQLGQIEKAVNHLELSLLESPRPEVKIEDHALLALLFAELGDEERSKINAERWEEMSGRPWSLGEQPPSP